MIFNHFIGLIIGYVMSTVLSILLTVLRFGIPECNLRIKNESSPIIIVALKQLKNRYKISLIIWITIISLVSIGCYFWLKTAFIGYLIGLFINIISILKTSGKTPNNLLEFENSLTANISYIINEK